MTAAFLNQRNLLELSIMRTLHTGALWRDSLEKDDAVPKQPFYLWPAESHKYVSYK